MIHFKKYDKRTRYSYRQDLEEVVKQSKYESIIEMIVREYQKGKSLREVAEMFGRTHQFIKYHLDRVGLEKRGRGGWNHIGKYPFCKKTERRILELRKKGYCFAEIGRRVNLPPWCIQSVLRRKGGDES